MADIGPGCAAFDDFADYYDMAMAILDRGPEIEFYCGLIDDEVRSLLELGCGTGTVTIPIARKLIARNGPTTRLVGIDESGRMLEVARLRAPEIEWMQGDMRAPPVTGTFDLVICCFNGVQLLLSDDDVLRFFRLIRDILPPRGAFAFDLYQPNLDFLNATHADRRVRSFIDRQGRSLEVRESGEYDPASRILMTDWRLVEQDRADAAPIARLRVPLRQYFSEQIESFLIAAGLAMRERYGDFDRSPFTPASKRQIVVCGR